MFRVEKVFVHPNIAITVRFTPVLHEWLKSVAEREGVSFNQLVLQCCKYCMEMDMEDMKKGEQKEGNLDNGGDTSDRNL